MIIDGTPEPLRPLQEGSSRRNSSRKVDATGSADKTSANRSEQLDKRQSTESSPAGKNYPVYNTDGLRSAASQLLEDEGIESTRDGDVRHNRVEEVRRKLDAGDYQRREIFDDVVDRLIDKWNILEG